MDARCVICADDAISFLPYRGINKDKPLEKRLFEGSHTSRCQSCHHAFCSKPIDPALLGKYYESEFASERRGNGLKNTYDGLKSKIRALSGKYIGSKWTGATLTQVSCANELLRGATYESRSTSISVLEVGAGDAEFSRCLREKYKSRFSQIRLNAVEPSPAFDVYYQGLGIVKRAKTIEELARTEETYDIVCFSHCLEHFIDPVAVITECRRHLKKDGVVVVEVPNCDDTYWQYRFFPDPPHLHFFNHRSLKTLFELCGFNVGLLRSYGYKNEVEREIGYLKKNTPPLADSRELRQLEKMRNDNARSFVKVHGSHSPYTEDFTDYLKAPIAAGRNYLFLGATRSDAFTPPPSNQ